MQARNHALLSAAARGQTSRVTTLLREGAEAHFQDTDGKSALMLAAGNGHVETLTVLLDAGAPWNATDKSGRCAGEYATDGRHREASELLLEADLPVATLLHSVFQSDPGARAELVLGALERATGRLEERQSSTSYLDGRLEHALGGDGKAILKDAGEMAVMMAWEAPIMRAHAQAICSRGGDILNIGFGLGIVDEAIQEQMQGVGSQEAPSPAITSHTIIEAHPDVFARMQAEGWESKPGVKILFGRWQDVHKGLSRQYDGIFFDTYSEFYDDLRSFHELLPSLLRKGGLYSFFNGLAADNPFFHTVCCTVCERELAQLGLDTQFVPLQITNTASGTWTGVQNKYWQLDTYFLPVSEWADNEDE